MEAKKMKLTKKTNRNGNERIRKNGRKKLK